jgi:hypothetical protein
MSSCTVLDPLGVQAVRRPWHLSGCGGEDVMVSLLAIFSIFTCFMLCCVILILSCTQDHFRLAKGLSMEMSSIVFDKAA